MSSDEPELRNEYTLSWDAGGLGDRRRIRSGSYESYDQAVEALRGTLSTGLRGRLNVKVERRLVGEWEEAEDE